VNTEFQISNPMENKIYCNNCGKQGHTFYFCKIPITSYGTVVFRINNGVREYLMIRRQNTLGYIDFMRGKYSLYNKNYIKNMLNQMTKKERKGLRYKSFDVLWRDLWSNTKDNTDDDDISMNIQPIHKIVLSNKYRSEEIISRDKFNKINKPKMENNFTGGNEWTLNSLIDDCEADGNYNWEYAEWGFPKGRRNYREKDYDCALREMTEETGYLSNLMRNVRNVLPFEEIFMGSNYKSYKHKYYLMYMNYSNSLSMGKYDRGEVGCIEWKSYDECMKCIRNYNIEKKKLITNIDSSLNKYMLFI
jgi:8-oxo-dGTP pyrophosphatase MutT (NUDIX family)